MNLVLLTETLDEFLFDLNKETIKFYKSENFEGFVALAPKAKNPELKVNTVFTFKKNTISQELLKNIKFNIFDNYVGMKLSHPAWRKVIEVKDFHLMKN